MAYCSNDPGARDDNWLQFAWLSLPIKCQSITAAELEAAAAAHCFLYALLADGGLGNKVAEFFQEWMPEEYGEEPNLVEDEDDHVMQ